MIERYVGVAVEARGGDLGGSTHLAVRDVELVLPVSVRGLGRLDEGLGDRGPLVERARIAEARARGVVLVGGLLRAALAETRSPERIARAVAEGVTCRLLGLHVEPAQQPAGGLGVVPR